MGSSLRIEELKKKFEENPRRYFAPLANEYRKAGDVGEAIRICRAHLPQQPAHMSGHIVFGQALYESGELDESREVFEAALALDPENLIALRHLGDIARVRDDVVSARRWYERVLDADPRNEEIAALIASLPGSSPAPAAASDGAFGWGEVNPEAPAPPARTPEEPTPMASLLELDEPPSAPAAQPLAGFEATSAGAADDFPEFEGSDSAAGASDQPTVAFEAYRTPTHASGADGQFARSHQTPGAGAGSSEFDLDSFDAGPPAPAASSPGGSAASEIDDSEFDALFGDEPVHATAAPEPEAPPAAEPPATDTSTLVTPHIGTPAIDSPPRSASWDRGPVSMEAQTGGQPTIDAHAASPADYGFETMEFVPPPRDDAPGGAYDDVRVPEIDPAEASPAAFVTETMAELYLQQGFHDEALSVYRQLLAQNPHDPGLRERVYQLEHGARSSISMAAMVEAVAPPTGGAEAPDGLVARGDDARAPSARSFFAALAARRAPAGYESAPYDAASYEPAPPESGATPTEMSASRGAHAEEHADGATLSAADALEPASLDYMADAGAPGDVLPTVAEVSALETGDTAGAPSDAPPADGGSTLDSLFGGATVTSADERAAATLASVFAADAGERGDASIQGRPTRAASTEISLDSVFRDGTQQPAQRRSAGFSFDQFFAESAGGSAQPAPAPQGGAPETPDASGDIEQFNEWLEGLKKK